MSAAIYPWINFGILFLGLAFILNRALGAQFKKQRAELDEKIKAANKEHEAMRREYEEARGLISALEERMSELKFNASREVQLETKKMEFETERFIEKILADGELKMKAEILAMKASLERDLLAQSLSAARQVLERDLKTKDAEWTSNMLQGENTDETRKNYAS